MGAARAAGHLTAGLGAVAEDEGLAQNMARNGVAVVGDALIDVVISPDGGERRSPGGAGLNLAVGLARLGGEPTLVCQLGDDDDGRDLQQFLAAEGVEVWAQATPHGTGLATSRETAGLVEYEFSTAVIERNFKFTPDLHQVLRNRRAIVLNSYPIGDRRQVDEMLATIQQTGCLLAVDPNVRPALMPDLDSCREGLDRLAQVATLVKLSREDLTLLYPDRSNEGAVAALLSAGARAVVETDGPRGAYVHTAGYTAHVPSVPLGSEVVSTVGAGDAVLARLSLDLGAPSWPGAESEWRSVLQDAMAAAAATCQAVGGTIPLTYAQTFRGAL